MIEVTKECKTEKDSVLDGVQPAQMTVSNPELIAEYRKLSNEGKIKVLEFINALRDVPRYWRGK